MAALVQVRRRALPAAAIVAVVTALTAPFVSAPAPAPLPAPSGPPRVIAWNDLGMHCIDPDFSIFSILPPYNTINSQLMIGGQLVTAVGPYSVTYEAVADANGSINSTSVGKTNFWQYAQALYGAVLAPDVGLTGNAMPGLANVPQPMHFDGNRDWFQGEGIPITPIDDAHVKNPYPLMRIVVRNTSGAVVASTVTVAPNSAELECSRCHASGASPDARPEGGWVFDPEPVRDDHFNILKLHDRHLGEAAYDGALLASGYGSAGLFAGAVAGTPVLCAACHGTNALPGTGLAGVAPMTEAMHGLHANVRDETGTPLDDNPTRTSCYLCHPGTVTQCLRGAMGKAIGPDGDFSMHCQSCHGAMADVGEVGRVGWFDQPTCDNCHTGTATLNNGAIRFTDVYDINGNEHVAVSDVFATDADTPIPGFSLYRFSTGHGELQCSACHGSPHAIQPTNFANDNLQFEQLQGHAGTLSECSVCHTGLEDDQLLGGPHSMHPATAAWANGKHGDFADNDLQSCRACHGTNDRGTVLSLAQDHRSYTNQFGTQVYARGNVVGCYDCHNGPNGENDSTNPRPVASALSVSTPTDVAIAVTLAASDAQPLTYRIVEQPKHGTVAFSGGTQATYRAKDGYVGLDEFTYAAQDPLTDSNVATVHVNVTAPACRGSAEPYGHACVGSNDTRPSLSVSGCPTPGASIAIHFDDFVGGSVALLGVATSPAAIEIVPDCTLRLGAILFDFIPVVSLNGSGSGQGSAVLNALLPATLGTQTLYLQAFGYDPSQSFPFVGSNGVELHVE